MTGTAPQTGQLKDPFARLGHGTGGLLLEGFADQIAIGGHFTDRTIDLATPQSIQASLSERDHITLDRRSPHTDDLGRVKVRFFWDRSGVRDDTSSRWVRTLQMNLTAPQVIPRVGWEVPIVYENGDPDRPFVLGRLYNGGAPPPYGLPGKSATSTLQSGTSPSDGTTQEIRLADDAGSEEAFIHATCDQTVSVGGSHTVTVAGNRTGDVTKTQTLKVDAAQDASVGGNQKVTVGADGTIAVASARSESVGGNESVGVTGTYAVTVSGAYSEVIGGLYSLRCNQYNATVQGAFTQVIGGVLAVTAGLGSNQSVAGARTEVVGGARSFTAPKPPAWK